MRGIHKIVISSLLIAFLVIIVIVARVLYITLKGQCMLLDEAPIVNTSSPVYFRSQDNLALINFIGYLILRTAGPLKETYVIKYLPLNLKDVKYFVDKENKIYLLQADLECARMFIEVLLLAEDRYVVADLSVEHISSYRNASRFDPCHVHPAWFNTRSDEYYECNREQVYGCWDVPYASISSAPRLVSVELVASRFEFEINGDPKEIENGRFSKKPFSC